jgi:hypothetical protein
MKVWRPVGRKTRAIDKTRRIPAGNKPRSRTVSPRGVLRGER